MRLTGRLAVLAVLGLVVAGIVGVGVAHLAGRQIGMADQPLGDVRGLAPPATTSRRPQPSKTTTVTTPPAPASAPEPLTAPVPSATARDDGSPSSSGSDDGHRDGKPSEGDD